MFVISVEHRDILDIANFRRSNCDVVVSIPDGWIRDLGVNVELRRNRYNDEGIVSGIGLTMTRGEVLRVLLPHASCVFREDGCDIGGRFLPAGRRGVAGTINLAAFGSVGEIGAGAMLAMKFLSLDGFDAAFLNVAGWKEALKARGIEVGSSAALSFAEEIAEALTQSRARIAISDADEWPASLWGVTPGLRDGAGVMESLELQAVFERAGATVVKRLPVLGRSVDDLLVIVQHAASLGLSGVWFDRPASHGP
jgi:hypothetical protein